MLAPPKRRPVVLGREELVGELVTDQACLLGLVQQETQLVAVTFVGHILKSLTAGCNEGVDESAPDSWGQPNRLCSTCSRSFSTDVSSTNLPTAA
jgi:hypothetical protein